jgi:predicted CXXCH cytochrome family protein
MTATSTRRNAPLALVLAIAGCFAATASFADGGAYRSTRHADREKGVQRVPDQPRGACVQCHEQHSTRQGQETGGPYPFTLFAPNDNELCLTCHQRAGEGGVFPGSMHWQQSAHALSSSMTWPAPKPGRKALPDAGACLNCHAAHGATDPNGVIPSMLRLREEALCTTCHNGTRARDIARDFQKPYRHPVEISGRHDALEKDRTAFGDISSQRRHAECMDCHNPHLAEESRFETSGMGAAPATVGTGRIVVVNGIAGTMATYAWRGPEETHDAREFELCFKCHSSWTTQPIGQSDLALLTNPNNPSYHPIQGRGKNAHIDRAAFVDPWDASSTVTCSDCHGTDDPDERGPHGSAYEHILKRPVPSRTSLRPMEAEDLCFSCHTYAAYADPSATQEVLRASRFNPPAGQGHAFHVGVQGLSCSVCHETHGSVRRPALIATGARPGIVTFMQTPNGGACTPTCHTTRSYGINYAR